MGSWGARHTCKLLSAAALAGVLIVSPASHAQGLPDYDAREAAQRPVAALQALAAPALASGTAVRFDSITGAADRVSRQDVPLTAPSSSSPEHMAREFLLANPSLFRLKTADLGATYVVRRYTSPGLGATHLWVAQQQNRIPVFGSETKFDLDAHGRLLAVSGSMVPSLAGTLAAARPGLTPTDALQLGLQYAGARFQYQATPLHAAAGPRQSTPFPAGPRLSRDPAVELVYFPIAPGRTVLAWETTLWQNDVPDVYHLLVDASTGALLFRKNYTDYAQGLVFDREAPQDGAPYPGFEPPVRARALLPFDGTGIFSNADPHFDWWAGAAQTQTRGNNVSAGPLRHSSAQTLFAVNAGNGDFSFPLDLSQDPSHYQEAATANLFYWVNVCHDVWYKFGFNEAAGNFQTSNFGSGGEQGDAVVALAQFGADDNPPSLNNANFSTPPDGQGGVMRMFLWSTNPMRDGDLASDVICHEYMHGVSNRLVGNGNGLSGFQSRAMGEGWSDFASLMIHALASDDVNGVYPVGGYVVNRYATGIRSQPYSRQSAVFNRTYAGISDARYGSPEFHLAGEIMCNALWQTYGRLVSRLGFEAGRTRTMQLFIDALKLCPTNPTYLDYRDALLRADRTRYAAADKDDIWTAFASRGMGLSASTAGANDTHPHEAFDRPAAGFGISGTVTLNGAALAGATLSIGGRSTVTGTGGGYTIGGLAAGTFTVTPSRAGFVFTPASRTVTVGPGVNGINFTATPLYSISGRVTLNGSGLAGVTIRAVRGNGEVKTTYTAPDGGYGFPNLQAGSYTMSAAKTGRSFTYSGPANPVVIGPSKSGVSFTAR